jgi:hypothetical protein
VNVSARPERFAPNENEKGDIMKRITTILFFTLVLLVAGVANAQMMGGGNHHGIGGNPGNGQNGGMGDMPGMVGMGNHRGLIVGADGTVYTMRISNPTTTQAATFEVVAVRPSGAIGWTASVNAGMTFIELSGTNLLVTTSPHGFDMGYGQAPTTTSSALVALSTVSGSVQWTLQLDGFAFDIEPFAGGTYVTVVKPAQSTNNGGMHGGTGTVSYGTRTLIAVGNDGKVLWSVPLNK